MAYFDRLKFNFYVIAPFHAPWIILLKCLLSIFFKMLHLLESKIQLLMTGKTAFEFDNSGMKSYL